MPDDFPQGVLPKIWVSDGPRRPVLTPTPKMAELILQCLQIAGLRSWARLRPTTLPLGDQETKFWVQLEADVHDSALLVSEAKQTS